MKLNKLLYICLLLLFSSNSLFSQFGKNKVQYEEFDWKFISSKHFDVFYADGSKYIAEYTAVTAEQALLDYKKLLDYEIPGRVKIIVYNSHNEFQQTNVIGVYMGEGVGGVTELMKNRVVVPFQGDYAVFRHVIRHELIHAVVNYMFYGGNFQTAMQTDKRFMLPIWMNEGLAEFSSIGGLNADTDMFMRDLAINEKVPPLYRMNGYLAYRGGQFFYWYISQKYGNDIVAILLKKLRFHRDMDDAFEAVFGKNVEEFSELFVKDIKKMYWPDLTRYKSTDEFSSILTDHIKDRTYYNSSPAISPDGQKMAYISAPEGQFSIFVRDIDDKESSEKLVSSMRTQDFEDLNMVTPGISWSPDNKKLAISAKTGGQDAVFIVDVKSGKYEKLKWGLKTIASVHWSPDGGKLVFFASNSEKSDLFLYDFNTKVLTKLTDDIYTNRIPVWSSDSKEVYFLSDRDKDLKSTNKEQIKMWKHNPNNVDIYSIQIINKNITRITATPHINKSSIVANKANDKIIYVADINGIGNLYELDLDNNTSRPLTNSITGITQISLSIDDSKLLYTAQNKGGSNIFMINYPFDLKQEQNELPLTELNKRQTKTTEIIKETSNIDKEKNKQKLDGYGDFNVDFSAQEIIQANDDIDKLKYSNITDTLPEYDDDDFIEQDYVPNFSMDMYSANPAVSTYYGFQGAAQLLFSDQLGDHQIMISASLQYNLRNSNFFLVYNYLPKVIDYTFLAYHTSGMALGTTTLNNSNPDIYGFRKIGFGAISSYSSSIFRRFEFGSDFMYLDKTNLLQPWKDDSEERFLIAPYIRAVYDNTIWSHLGPVDGRRYFLKVLGSPSIDSEEGISFISVTADYREYIRFASYFTIALRATGGVSFGENKQNFFIGGTSNWFNRSFNGREFSIDHPEDFAFMDFQMPMRGFAIAHKSGSSFFLANAEFRFPLFTALVAGPLPILIQGIEGLIFADVGSAYNDKFNISLDNGFGQKVADDLLMSAGFGVRGYLLGMPMKLDMAWQHNLVGWSKPIVMYSLGYNF